MAEKDNMITTVDVRDQLRAGREPFQQIMAAAETVPVGGRLILYATFKPVPLISVLRSQGFQEEASEIEGGDWRVDFERISLPASPDPTLARQGSATFTIERREKQR